MRLAHFDTFRPLCAVCRSTPLSLTTIIRRDGDDILEGIVACSDNDCRREYPIIDGIPVFIAAIRGWLTANPLGVLARHDLSPELESLLTDVAGPGSAWETLRQQTGIYAADHYDDDGGSAVQLLDAAMRLASQTSGPALDAGCATGRTTFRLAETTAALTLGIDLNFAMLRMASHALRSRRVRFARRRVGIAYDAREIDVDLPGRDLVDFWCCDAQVLPLADATFTTITALNLIDCTGSPRDVLAELARVLRAGGHAFLATPYDWTTSATPVEAWIGGHSQRSENRGASEPVLRAILDGTHPAAVDGLEIVAEDEHVPWRVRLHDRSAVDYDVHVIAVRKRD